MRSLLVADCVSRFLEWVAVNRRPKTLEHYRYQLERFADHVGALTIDRLTPALVSSWSRSFHPVQSVLRLCRWCHLEERSLEVNPLLGMRKPRGGQRKRVLERLELVRLCRGADACFRAFLIFLRETMCRPQEAQGMRWADLAQVVDGARGGESSSSSSSYFVVPAAKGWERRRDLEGERIIPISPRLSRLLERIGRDGVTLDSPILRDSRGRAWTANAVRCRMRRLRIRAGLEPDRRGERVVAYSLRHTGATAAAAAGVRDWMLAGLLGHASTRTTSRYVHLRPADLVEGAKRLWEVKPRRKPKNGRPGSLRTRPDDVG